jgi:hypothetical protein
MIIVTDTQMRTITILIVLSSSIVLTMETQPDHKPIIKCTNITISFPSKESSTQAPPTYTTETKQQSKQDLNEPTEEINQSLKNGIQNPLCHPSYPEPSTSSLYNKTCGPPKQISIASDASPHPNSCQKKKTLRTNFFWSSKCRKNNRNMNIIAKLAKQLCCCRDMPPHLNPGCSLTSHGKAWKGRGQASQES